ncbi:hypothetical protein F4803DRAFT_526178 [Xylaria telfairii]|nr:hypothetical protein F4803DRAFT_526178 [Xylaria telfairii]
MRYHEGCRHFKTSHWQTLWRNNLTTLDALKNSVKSPCTFVAIDFEGLRSKKDEPLGITDIGIAVLPFPRPTTQPTPDNPPVQSQRLQIFFEQNTIECHWLRLKGTRQIPGPKDTCHFGQLQEIEPTTTEAVLVALLKSVQQRSGLNTPLVLVGFDLFFEFVTITSHFSQILQFFSSWVDLKDIATEVSEPKNCYGLRDTLRAFGFAPGDIATSGGRNGHNAADDTIRELAVLVNLLQLPQESVPLHIETKPKKRYEVQRFWNGRAPGPKELYPFTARVYIKGKLLGHLLPHWAHIFDIFSAYNPIAVGLATGGPYGWVSLSSLEGLNRLIEDVHGKQLKGEMWNIVSKYDPSVIPTTPDQLSKAKQAAQEAERERKQLERRMKRESASDMKLYGVHGGVLETVAQQQENTFYPYLRS